jgi:hypothetical protein
MGKDKKQAAVQEHRDARENLARVSAATDDANDPTYLEANRRVIDAEKNVSWWRR